MVLAGDGNGALVHCGGLHAAIAALCADCSTANLYYCTLVIVQTCKNSLCEKTTFPDGQTATKAAAHNGPLLEGIIAEIC